MSSYEHLPYNPLNLERELRPFYISASDSDLQEMLSGLGMQSLDQLFSHIPDDVKFEQNPDTGKHLDYADLVDHLETLAKKNNPCISFLGDGVQSYKVPDVTAEICDIRGLTTAYTPYQPERSQGTLMTLWLYSSSLSMMTGFEAINSSMYDRSTCLYEALLTATRLKKRKNTVLVAENIFPGDWEVLNTLSQETHLKIVKIPVDKESGLLDKSFTQSMDWSDIAGIAFPQVNSLGLLEDVHYWTDVATENDIVPIAIIDPMLLSNNGLIPPTEYGKEKQGAKIIVGEGQHLSLPPIFGGPGLGIFGIRFNENDKLSIRSTPGRYVGKGEDALAMVLSTREQHIRRERATSNICSNQGFVASLTGAALLNRGDEGIENACLAGHNSSRKALEQILKCDGVKLAFDGHSWNEWTLEINQNVSKLIEAARLNGIHIGVDLTGRHGIDRSLLKISFTDKQSEDDIGKLVDFFKKEFKSNGTDITLPQVPANLKRSPNDQIGLPKIDSEELVGYYKKLGDLNVSPDDNIYPLGSCTMKYNPYINDYAANLPGFTDVHPQAPLEDAQGSLEVLYQTQEIFKGITGLPGLTTQPVAGAQGELVGLKMFQAYHRANGEAESRNIILIPKTAHGTNPATAAMAGLQIKLVEATAGGEIEMSQLEELIETHGPSIAGVMVTNPNTSGLFETNFKRMADLIHQAGGLVYMDGANMNAIANWIDLNAMGVDAVHNNLHKTWTIPHGGGGPGDAIVAVSERLLDFLPGHQIVKNGEQYDIVRPKKSIGSVHRHFGNFGHKVRCYTYLKALGSEGIRKMSAVAVLSSRYVHRQVEDTFTNLPPEHKKHIRMHEFILTLSPDEFGKIVSAGIPKAQIIPQIGKLFLDFGMHAPTVAFPEQFGLMIEPTESYSKDELDRFVDILKAIKNLVIEHPSVLKTAPHFTPVQKVDEVGLNKKLVLNEKIDVLPELPTHPIHPTTINGWEIERIISEILERAKLH